MSAITHVKSFEKLIEWFLIHNKRFAAFHRPEFAASGSKEIGHFHFGTQDTTEPAIHTVFDRSDCAKQIAPPNNQVDRKTSYLLQNDLLGAAERSFLEMTRPRIRMIAHVTALRAGHGNGKGVVQSIRRMTLMTVNQGAANG